MMRMCARAKPIRSLDRLVAVLCLSGTVGCSDAQTGSPAQKSPPVIAAHTPDRSLKAGSGPFGVDSGMTERQLRSLAGFGPSDSTGMTYQASMVPKPHADFESYVFVISPTVGLCRVGAIGKTVENDSYGGQLKSMFTNLDAALTAKYGDPKRYDFLRAGALWNEPREWMMALRQKERILSSFWGDSTALSDNAVTTIALTGSGLSSDSGYLVISYEFGNVTTCMRELKQKANAGL